MDEVAEVKCAICKELMEGEGYEHPTYGLICSDCDSELIRCEFCEEHFLEEDMVEYDTGGWRSETKWACDDCADTNTFRCGSCRTRYTCDVECTDPNGNSICQSCYEEHCCACDECGDTLWRQDANYRNDSWYCDDCMPNADIYGYHDYPCEWKFYSDGSAGEKTPYMGWEIEVDTNDDPWESPMEFMSKYFIPTEDGSLSSNGIEWVSHPQSVAYTRKNWHIWEEFFNEMKNQGYDADSEDCGSHVHISRKWLGKKGTYNLMLLVNHLYDDLYQIADRQRSCYCSRNINTKASEKRHLLPYIRSEVRHSGRQAVNTGRADTVEIRLWAGIDNLTRFKAMHDLTYTLCRIAKVMTAGEILLLTVEDVMKMLDFKDSKNYFKNRYFTSAQKKQKIREFQKIKIRKIYSEIFHRAHNVNAFGEGGV
jgi:hypothetical protein